MIDCISDSELYERLLVCSPCVGLDHAVAKQVVHKDASIVAQDLPGSVAACLLNLASYCSRGLSSYSLLALIIIELYARRSPT